MENFNPLTELIFRAGDRDEQAVTVTVPSHYRAGVFIWDNFQAGYRDLGNQANAPSHMNTSTFLQRKEWRGGASPVDQVHMNRP